VLVLLGGCAAQLPQPAAADSRDARRTLRDHGRNQIRIGTAEHTFTRLTTPTPLQAHALQLLDVKLHQ